MSNVIKAPNLQSSTEDGNITGTTVGGKNGLDVNIISSITVDPPVGGATEAKQDSQIALATDGTQKTQITNSSGTAVTTKTLATQVVSTDLGLVGQVVIHGVTTGGGGGYVDVKVNPSGAIVTDNSGVTQPVSDGGGSLTVDGTVAATQSGAWDITNISGTVSLPTGAATAAKQPALGTAGTASADVITVQGIASMTALKVDGSAVTQPVSDAGGSLTVDGTVAATQSGTWTVQPGNTANTTAWLVKEETAGTATLTNVASSATSVSILASNSSRKGAMIYNDSTQVLYLKFGTTASSSSYTVQLSAGAYYELPGPKIYTGAIDGIWASANGNARVTELT